MNPEDAQIESDRGDEHIDNVSYALTPEGRIQVANERIRALRAEVDILRDQVALLTEICSHQQDDINEHAADINSLVQAGFLAKETLDTHTKDIKSINHWLTRSG